MTTSLFRLVSGWVLFAAGTAPAQISGSQSQQDNSAPYVVARAAHEYVETVGAGAHSYEIRVGGTLDEFNTAGYPDTYGGSMRLESKFQPNDYLVIENVGEMDAVNPRIVVNGRRSWFSADDILAGILKSDMSEAEKAMAIWAFTGAHEVQAHDNNRRVGPAYPAVGTETDNHETSHPSRNTFQERANPVKAANSYYCSGCSLSAANFVVLCRHAGLVSRAVWMSALDTYRNHCVGEVWYDGGWHLFDPELRAFFLEADNTTVASYESLHRNPSLESRTHKGGFAGKGMPPHAPEYGKYFPPHVMPVEQWLSTMAMTLRPGESFVRRWDHVGKYRYGDNVRGKSNLVPYQLANGRLIYRPRLSGPAFWRGAVSGQNIRLAQQEGQAPRVHPEVVAAAGCVLYRIRSPYPMVGGAVSGTFLRKSEADACRICVSVHDSDWTDVWSADGIGELKPRVALDAVMNPRATAAIYDYYVRFELRAASEPTDAALSEICIETDVQMAATALPSLSVGVNKVEYRDESDPGAKVRITHGWHESTATRPPLPPAGPVTPGDGGEVDPASLATFSWQPATDPDGQAIADYHIQVSPRADMLHAVSPNFDRLTFSGKPEWKIPEGWLVNGRRYYWRVRARDEWGAWSDWSPVRQFRVRD
jgi:hypothetical protein